MKTFILTLSAFVLLLTPTTCSLDPKSYEDPNNSVPTLNATDNLPTGTNTDGSQIDPPIMPTKPV